MCLREKSKDGEAWEEIANPFEFFAVEDEEFITVSTTKNAARNHRVATIAIEIVLESTVSESEFKFGEFVDQLSLPVSNPVVICVPGSG